MAAGGALKDFCEEATCSICLDYFSDRVMTECGHCFCRVCLTRSWEESGAQGSCPQCRGTVREGSLRPNLPLSNFAEIAKKFSPQGGKEAAAKREERKEGVCEKHQEPLKFFCKDDEAPVCVVCIKSKQHKTHEVILLEEASQHKTPLKAGKGNICEKHQEPLKLFCKDDEALICLVCDSSTEHKYHDVIPIEEASQEYKEKISSYLEILKEQKTKMMVYKADVMKDSQHLLKQTKAESQKVAFKFRQLHKFLEEQEKLLLAQMEEVEKEVARKRDTLVKKLTEEMSSYESIIQEMEWKCQQLDSEFLQDIRSTLQRYEEKEKLEKPVVLPLALKWAVWDFCDINTFLEGVIKQFNDTIVVGLQQQKAANVTLDPDTAYLWLNISEDRKSVKWETRKQDLPQNPKRFSQNPFVLAWEGFTAGRHFWEVSVKTDGEKWGVGIARKSVNRKTWINTSPEEGIWTVVKICHPHGNLNCNLSTCLCQCGNFSRIRVSLNYAGGRVAFFDADRAALLYAFSGASFSGETIHPFFAVDQQANLVLGPY